MTHSHFAMSTIATPEARRRTGIRLLGVFCAALALNAKGDTYILGGELNESNVGSSSSPVSWSDTTNWTPAAVPGSTDEINWAPNKSGSNRYAYLSLDDDYDVGSLSANFRHLDLYNGAANSQTVILTFYGQLGDGQHQWHTVNNGVKLVIDSSAALHGAWWDGTASSFTLGSGAEVDVYGNVTSRHIEWSVPSGAILRLDPASYQNFTSGEVTASAGDTFNFTGGNVYFPNGLSVSGGNAAYANAINQSAGTVEVGGDFSSAVTAWTYTWSGGTLAVTDDATFGANIALVVPASAAVSLNIASGKTFSAPGLTADATASITVTGGGTFSIAPTTVPIILQNGSLGLATSGTYDLSNVSAGSGAATIALTALGARVNSLPAALSGATFTADLSSAAAGTVVFQSTDSAVLAKVKSDLEGASSVPQGFELAISGETLSLEEVSNYVFDSTSVTDLLNGAGWNTDSVPPANASVAIAGANVTAVYSSGTIPAWSSIEVKNGATLRFATNATPPSITLNKSATLDIANGATVTLANAGNLSAIAAVGQVPVLSVASDATLSVPGGMKFSNVDIVLEGTIDVTTAGGVTFGYAAAGETAYFGFTSNGGTISLTPGSGDYNTSPLEFCCPASGGTVNAIRSLVLANTTILPVYERSGNTYPLTVAYQIALYMGVNNPANIPFEVVFDNTKWGVLGSLLIKGGATFRLANGGTYQNFESIGYWGRYAQISENGRLVVGSGCEFRLNALGDYGSNPLEVNPSSADYPAIVVEDGGVFETYRFSGNGKGVFVASNSVYTIYMPSLYNEHYSASSGTTTIYDTANVPFLGLSSVNIATNSTLTFSTRNKVFWDSGQFDENSGDRVVKVADVPITGGGSITLSNANANVFGVIVQSGANTATGSAGVTAPAPGMGATTLYFANGANWAGTVVVGNVSITNLTDGAAAATVSFGALDLTTNFPIRAWRANSGRNLPSDTINVGQYVNGGGKLVPTMMTDGDVFTAGDKITLGSISSSSPLPAVERGWRCKLVDNGLDNDTKTLILSYSRGLQIMLQ